MITLDDIRAYATSLPEVEEKSHFNLPGFRVRDKLFVHLEKDATHAIVCVSQAEAATAAAGNPGLYEEVSRRNGEIFVGLRVDLSDVPAPVVQQLVENAWRNKAPQGLVASYDETA